MAKYDWGDGKGKVHSISLAQHQQNMAGGGHQQIGVGSGLIGAVTAPSQPYQQPQTVNQTATAATALPPDPMFLAQQAAAQRTLALGNAWDTYARGRIENEYGLGSDVSNPYSRARLLEQDYQTGQRGTALDYANAGQLYSGASQNATDYNANKYSQNYDALKRSYQSQKDAITKGAIDRTSGSIANISQEDLAALLRQLGS